MGKTNTKRIEARNERLKALPQSERLLKSALIKKKEGRVLDASEKHALKMASERGEILKLWEQLRTTTNAAAGEGDAEGGSGGKAAKKTAFEHKYPIVDKLLRLIEPSFANLVKTPSVSRVLQSMIKYGSSAHVEAIVRLLSRDYLLFATDSFAHYVIAAAIRHASHDVYTKLYAATLPCVPTLVSHAHGIEVVHAVYSARWCSPQEAQVLLLAVFKDSVALMKKWVGYPSMEAILQGNPALQKRLLTRLFDVCDKLVSQKGAITFPFVQRLVLAYMRCGTKDEVSELCDTIRGLQNEGGKKRTSVATIALTREGAPLASLVFSLTAPGKRKTILQSVKENLGELVASKYAAPLVARLFDLVYDHQLLRKYVVNDMSAHLPQVVNSPYGYLVLMHLLTPRAARKERFLLPNWREHNLFSLDNKEWNHHAWLTAHYEREVVEICDRPAMQSHLAVLPTLVEALLALLRDEARRASLNRTHVALLAREVLLVTAAEPPYAAALSLAEPDTELLASLAPARGTKRPREEDEEGEDAPQAAAPRKLAKKEPKQPTKAAGPSSSPKSKATTGGKILAKGKKAKK